MCPQKQPEMKTGTAISDTLEQILFKELIAFFKGILSRAVTRGVVEEAETLGMAFVALCLFHGLETCIGICLTCYKEERFSLGVREQVYV